MTREKLEKAKELIASIDELKEQGVKWKNSVGIYNIELYKSNDIVRPINTELVNFEELRQLTLERINKRREMLQQEFDAL